MSRDNFCILILIAVVAFLLIVMNRQYNEGFDNAPNQDSILSEIATKNNTPSINSQIIDSVGQQIANNANTNLGSLVSTNTTNMNNIPVDIFKEPTFTESGIPGPNPSKVSGAALNTSSTFNYSGLQNSTNSSLNSGDLLPSDNDVNEYNVNKPAITYFDANLTVNTVEKIGVDTQGSSKKNASQDLRGNVPCPKFVISPWNNSTIDPDTNLKSMYA
jgi:hypothetical protein